MKVWWVIAWDNYYPDGNLNNVRSTWETKEEAEREQLRLMAGSRLTHVPDHVEIVDVSELLGIDN